MNITDLLKDPNKIKEILEKAIDKKNKELAEMLIPIAKDPYLTYEYAREIVKRKIKKEWENILAQDSYCAYFYVSNILHEPFPKGEDSIVKDYWCSYYYARVVLRGPFIKGEDTIARNPKYAYGYVKNILKDRFIKGEKSIIDSGWVYDYVDFLKKIKKLNEFLKDHPEVKL